MTAQELQRRANVTKKRSSNGFPEYTEHYHVRLSAADAHNLRMIRTMIGSSCTDSEIIRAIIRCAAEDVLGGYDVRAVYHPAPNVTVMHCASKCGAE